jgi:putative glutamine amidotransferase
VDFCKEIDIPLLGVCRGMQFINDYFGGKLKNSEGHAGTNHKLTHTGGGRFSFLTDIFDNVNSYHNYEIDSMGNGLKVLSRSTDKCIESFEHESLKILGIMWHPERDTDTADTEIIRRFFE